MHTSRFLKKRSLAIPNAVINIHEAIATASPGPEAPTVADSPVRTIPGDEAQQPDDGIALCLSGGGYRAMLFHAGTLIRLNELGILGKLARVSSVSGGSITAGLLGVRWKQLDVDAGTGRCPADALLSQVINPLRSLASRTIDIPSVGWGALLPGNAADFVTRAYSKYLFGNATLQSLPDEGEVPRFVLNATNVQSGVLWRFSRPYMGDWRVGLIRNPNLPLSVAVAGSSAFPPVLSPLTVDLDPSQFDDTEGADLTEDIYRDRVVHLVASTQGLGKPRLSPLSGSARFGWGRPTPSGCLDQSAYWMRLLAVAVRKSVGTSLCCRWDRDKSTGTHLPTQVIVGATSPTL